MVDAHQNLNCSCDLTMSLSGMICHPRALGLCMINLPTKFEVFISTHYKDTKRDTEYKKWGGLGYLGATQGH